ncbi:MAG: DUF1499 domain-containing protein [Gemmatimonadota bacterium]
MDTPERPSRRRALLLAAAFGIVLAIVVSRGIWPSAPATLGVTNGTLGPCPGTPNCVHTGLRHPDGTEGLFMQGRIGRRDLVPQLLEVVEAMPRTRVISSTDIYIHAEVRSRLFRFVDDLELLVMPDRELVIRSASRVGQGDLGVNAARVADLRQRLEEAGLIR